MKLKNGFIPHDTGDEAILVPMGGAGFSGVVRGNRTLGAILDLLKTDITEQAIIEAMKTRFDAPEEVIARDVKKAISELRKIGALDE
jgi:hypothetical protein